MLEIKSCPWCGGKAVVSKQDFTPQSKRIFGSGSRGAYVYCAVCMARGPMMMFCHYGENTSHCGEAVFDAVRQWNCVCDKLKSNEAGQLADRLDKCSSYVNNYGEWKYDRVPASLVEDLLDYLRNVERTLKNDSAL